jgi:hypothetical protein
MKKLVLTAVCSLALVGFVIADEIACTITKVDGNTVYYFTGGGKAGGEKKEGKATAAADVKVVKGMFDKDAGVLKAGDPIENGLKNDMFTKIEEGKGVGATITTNDKGVITQIITKGGKGKKKID